LVSTDHYWQHMVAQAEKHFVPGMMSGVEQAASSSDRGLNGYLKFAGCACLEPISKLPTAVDPI
jgi:hypothetical protein